MKKNLRHLWVILSASMFGFAGCSSLDDNPIHRSMDGQTVEDLYNQESGTTSGVSMIDSRHAVRGRSLDADLEAQASGQFSRIPNPEMVMFFFPRVYEQQGVVIPAFSVNFSMYKSVKYALPSEYLDEN